MIYLDNAATTKPKFFAKDYSQYWFNSNTNYAMTEQMMLDGARETIKDCLGVKTGKVLFCRCATEAVDGLVKKFCKYGDSIYSYCSPYEHDSVYSIVGCTNIESKNLDEQYLTNDNIYLHQYANQLTGQIFDIADIGKKIQATGAYFGSDFTASIGHAPIPKNLDSFCDALKVE